MQASIATEKKNKQIVERFIQSIKSEVTQVNVIDYINAYMRHWHLYEEEEAGIPESLVPPQPEPNATGQTAEEEAGIPPAAEGGVQ